MVWVLDVVDQFDHHRLFYIHKSSVFGRGKNSVDISIPNLHISVSRRHMLFTLYPPTQTGSLDDNVIDSDLATRMTYTDLGSKGGTIINTGRNKWGEWRYITHWRIR